MITKEDIKQLIVEEKRSTLSSHLQIFFSWDFTRYYGEVKKNKILLWSSSYWLRLNYPVFLLRFDENDVLEGIKLENNPFNKVIRKLIPLIIGCFIISFFMFLKLKAAITISMIFTVFSLIFYLLIKNQLNFEKKNMLYDLRNDLFQLEQTNNPSLVPQSKHETEPSKEWTFSKIFLRIFLYPFCLGLIYISITSMLPSEKPIYGLLGIGVGLSYLITDIRLSFKKSRSKELKNEA